LLIPSGLLIVPGVSTVALSGDERLGSGSKGSPRVERWAEGLLLLLLLRGLLVDVHLSGLVGKFIVVASGVFPRVRSVRHFAGLSIPSEG